MKRVVVCLLLSAILLAACSNEKTEESLAPSEDAAVSTAFSEEGVPSAALHPMRRKAV